MCSLSEVVEDEQHVVYDCPRYDEIRNSHQHLTRQGDISNFLNPAFADMVDTAIFIHGIESKRDDLNL